MLAEKALFEAWRIAHRELVIVRELVCDQQARGLLRNGLVIRLREAEAAETAAKRAYDKAFPDTPISRLHGRPMKKGER